MQKVFFKKWGDMSSVHPVINARGCDGVVGM